MSDRRINVGFLLPSAFDESSSIWRKVLHQSAELQAVGARSVIFSFTGPGSDKLKTHVHVPLEPGHSKEKQLKKLVEKVLQSDTEIVYVRRELWHPSYCSLMRGRATIAEINTLERSEFKLTMSLARRMYAAVTARFWRIYPAGFISVTHELAAAAVPRNKPKAVISNGIAGPRRRNNSVPEGPHLFFSCTGSFAWHGIDKFVTMARMFPDWQFSFAGELPRELHRALPSNFKHHGQLSAEEADRLLESANIGVGTLALHRKAMNEACPLKLRSYLAFGLPSIIAYRDTDFTGNFPFIGQISNTEHNITAEKGKISRFVLENYASQVPWEEVQFASEAEKARLRLRFFEQILRGGGARK
jgi:hypothetical protein